MSAPSSLLTLPEDVLDYCVNFFSVTSVTICSMVCTKLYKLCAKRIAKANNRLSRKFAQGARLTAVCKEGHLPALLWCKSRLSYPICTVKSARVLAREGRFSALQRLVQEQPADQLITWINEDVAHAAARGGHQELLQWIFDRHYCEPCEHLSAYAARGGHLELVQWAYINSFGIDSWTFAAAALGGNFDVLNYLYEHGCEMDIWTSVYARVGNHQAVLKWALDRDCPYFETMPCGTSICSQGWFY